MSRRCKAPGCRVERQSAEFCPFHLTEKQHGTAWAKVCHPTSPAAKEKKDGSRSN